jgi:threonyl-tRNA synthetase
MPQDLNNIRHSLAHLLAAAVEELYPGAKRTIGPTIDNGFYYDFEFAPKYTPVLEDLPKIEAKMRELLPTWKSFDKKETSAKDAKKMFEGNEYKIELITDLEAKNEAISLYQSGNFIDLCRGGHVEHPDTINPRSFELSRLAGAYWRGDEKNTMLTRIYGLAFNTPEELKAYKEQMIEAEKRDHRKLGKDLSIFAFDEDVGPGLPLWLPHGTVIIEELEKLAKEKEFEYGYVRVRTPHLAKESMYKKSGHLPYYEDVMYPPMEYEGGKYYLKAMNCPHHHKIFAAEPRSYRDLPLRLAEYGTCYRHEKSGELFGLMRVRSLQMNDAHMYCTEEQFDEEFRQVNNLYLEYFKLFGIEKYTMRFSTHDPKRLGEKFVNEPELWKKTEDMVRRVLVESKVPFVEVANEAAFYGPKIDIQVWSAIGREFTLATNQVDFAVPRRFGLTYTTAEGKEATPLCIHRAPLSTHERMVGFLIEHYGGNFPLWLSPVQVKIVPVGEAHEAYAKKLEQTLRKSFVRVEVARAVDTLGKRIRAAETMKIPLILVVGDKEIEANAVNVRTRGKKETETIPFITFLESVEKQIKERAS